MTRDKIIEMAIEAGLYLPENEGVFDYPEELEAFAKLVAAKEREEFNILFVEYQKLLGELQAMRQSRKGVGDVNPV